MAGQAIHKIQQSTTSPTLVILSDTAVATDAALCAWLEALTTSGGSQTAYGDGGRPETMLWSVRLTNNDPATDSGTAYLISDAAAKRLAARRYP
jgi:hypothetical protein